MGPLLRNSSRVLTKAFDAGALQQPSQAARYDFQHPAVPSSIAECPTADPPLQSSSSLVVTRSAQAVGNGHAPLGSFARRHPAYRWYAEKTRPPHDHGESVNLHARRKVSNARLRRHVAAYRGAADSDIQPDHRGLHGQCLGDMVEGADAHKELTGSKAERRSSTAQSRV